MADLRSSGSGSWITSRWSWAPPCRLKENVRIEAYAKADGVAIARRSSVGGTVVIGPGALNFAVILPIDAPSEES